MLNAEPREPREPRNTLYSPHYDSTSSDARGDRRMCARRLWCRDMREPVVALAAEYENHDGANGRGRIVCRARGWTRARELQRPAGVLPRAGDAHAVERFRHQDG